MARLILTEAGEDVDVGGNVTVIGTASGGEVITVLRGNIVLDPSFNTGGDTIRLPDLASAFTIRIQGATAILVSDSATLTVPIGSEGIVIAFEDVSRTLRYDTATTTAKLGDQIVTTSETGVLPAGVTGQTLGTAGDDTINGTAEDDVIDGLGGNDTINGHAGNDFLRGGPGDDTIDGGDGEDTILGGAGNDRIIDNEGGYGEINGGAGNDHISIDNLAITSVLVNGGDGDDLIELTFGTVGVAYVDAGAGNDRVVIDTQGMETILTLGTGRDELVLAENALANGVGIISVQDFEVGANGDVVNFADALASYLQNYTAGTNPFASGHFTLSDMYGNAYLQVDRDGAEGPNKDAIDVIIFAGVDYTTLTAENFGGFDPRASAASIAKIAATAMTEDAADDVPPFGAMAAAGPTMALSEENGPEPVAQRDFVFDDLAYEGPPMMALHVDHGSYLLAF